MKIVLDTNVWLSAVFWEGEASKIVEKAENKSNKVEIIISKEIISEVIGVLNKESKFQKFLEKRKQNIEELTRAILSISKLIETKTKLKVIEHDADNRILEAAIDGKVDYLVSYNKHILDVKEFKGVTIITPTDFLRLFKN